MTNPEDRVSRDETHIIAQACLGVAAASIFINSYLLKF